MKTSTTKLRYAKVYRHTHKQEIKLKLADYYQKHKEIIKKRTEIWRKNNPELVKEYDAKKLARYKGTPRYIYRKLRDSATRRGKQFNLEMEEFIWWRENQPKNCFYCDIPEEKLPLLGARVKNGPIMILTVDRVNNNLPYQLDNIVLACYRCNVLKGEYFSGEEAYQIAQLFVKPKWEALL